MSSVTFLALSPLTLRHNQKTHARVSSSSSAFKTPTWRLELGQEELARAQSCRGNCCQGRKWRTLPRSRGMGTGKGPFLLLLLEMSAYPDHNTMVLLLSAAVAEVKTGGNLRHSSCSLSLFTQAWRPV